MWAIGISWQAGVTPGYFLLKGLRLITLKGLTVRLENKPGISQVWMWTQNSFDDFYVVFIFRIILSIHVVGTIYKRTWFLRTAKWLQNFVVNHKPWVFITIISNIYQRIISLIAFSSIIFSGTPIYNRISYWFYFVHIRVVACAIVFKNSLKLFLFYTSMTVRGFILFLMVLVCKWI